MVFGAVSVPFLRRTHQSANGLGRVPGEVFFPVAEHGLRVDGAGEETADQRGQFRLVRSGQGIAPGGHELQISGFTAGDGVQIEQGDSGGHGLGGGKTPGLGDQGVAAVEVQGHPLGEAHHLNLRVLLQGELAAAVEAAVAAADPAILNSSRKKRIAAGAGTSVVEINKLLKQFELMQQLVRQMSGNSKAMKRMKRGGRGGFGGLGNLFGGGGRPYGF